MAKEALVVRQPMQRKSLVVGRCLIEASDQPDCRLQVSRLRWAERGRTGKMFDASSAFSSHDLSFRYIPSGSLT